MLMIVLNKGENAEIIYCTPLESATSIPAYYYFKFTNRITKDVISVFLTDTSVLKRYQKFTIDTDTLFSTFDTGFWSYTIQGSSVNTGTPTSPVLEMGYMYLNEATEFTPTKYDEQDNTFKTYNG